MARTPSRGVDRAKSGGAPEEDLQLPRLNLGSRTFTNKLVIHTDLKASEYADTWRAGFALGQLLEADLGQRALEGKSVLELGAGCGYTGLVAAQMGAKVVLSDRHPLIRVLTRNVAENRDAVVVQPVVFELDWTSGSQRHSLAAQHAHFDYILCSDCMYEEDCIEPLLHTLRDLCSPRRGEEGAGRVTCEGQQLTTQVLFSLETRGPQSSEIHAQFFARVSEWFVVKELTLDCSHARALMRGDIRIYRLQSRQRRG